MKAGREEGAFQVALVVKNLPADAENTVIYGLDPWVERSPGEGNGYPLQYSRVENPMDRGAWRTTVHRVTESDTTKVT